TRLHTLADVLDLALRLARVCLAAAEDRHSLLPECLINGQKHGIAPSMLLNLADRAMADLRQWAEILQVPTPEVSSLANLGEHSPGAMPVALHRHDGEEGASMPV